MEFKILLGLGGGGGGGVVVPVFLWFRPSRTDGFINRDKCGGGGPASGMVEIFWKRDLGREQSCGGLCLIAVLPKAPQRKEILTSAQQMVVGSSTHRSINAHYAEEDPPSWAKIMKYRNGGWPMKAEVNTIVEKIGQTGRDPSPSWPDGTMKSPPRLGTRCMEDAEQVAFFKQNARWSCFLAANRLAAACSRSMTDLCTETHCPKEVFRTILTRASGLSASRSGVRSSKRPPLQLLYGQSNLDIPHDLCTEG
ncbi:hypothetical protein V8F20_002034 [Naviculisporaceae sp. PSN 640]